MHTRPYWLALLVGAATALGLWLARPAPITAADTAQRRLSEPAPIPQAEAGLAQTFTVEHNGLSAVEVQVVYYGEASAPGAELVLALWGPDERLIAREQRTGLAHNDWVRLNFAPVQSSAGQHFRLELAGAPPYQTTAWAYTLDGYPQGELRYGAATAAGDLQFRTYYTYQWADAARDAAQAAAALAGLAVPLWLVLFAPGLALLALLQPSCWMPWRWARWGAALALSLAVLPLGWLWATTQRLGWTPWALGAVYAALGAWVAGRWVLAVARAWLRRRVRVRTAAFPGSQPVPVRFVPAAPAAPLGRHDAAMVLLLAASVLLRLIAVRDLALPPWVDASHHALVAGWLAETGRVPASLEPLAGAGAFTYHFGLHTAIVALDWFSDLGLPRVMLLAGQVLNGLVPLAIYAGTAALTGRRRAALLAAGYVGVVSFFPGYYATWGRYSQLAGLLVLPAAMGAIWGLLREAAGPAGQAVLRRGALAAAVLAAGTLLAHYRVFFFLLVFVAAAMVVHARGARRWAHWLGLAALAVGLLALPWLARLLSEAVLPLLGQPARLGTHASYNDFPVAYFRGVLERGALLLAGAAAVWGLLRRSRMVWALALWVGALFGLLNLGATTWLVNNNAWAISLFVPVAMLLGWAADHWLARTRRLLAAPPTLGGPLPPWRRATRLGLGVTMLAAAVGAAAYASMAGARAQAAIINPVTVLAEREDVDALEWVAANTPPEAVFVINGWKWLGESWTGSDGGAWLVPYTGRRATLPPVTYSFGEPAAMLRIWDVAQRVNAIQDANAPEALALLREQGVTHVFIGARGGSLKPEMFVGSPHYRLLFSNGAAWVFAVAPAGE